MNTDLSCRRCRDALVELTAGTLPTADRLAIERHLATCPDCRRERDRWLMLGNVIRERGRNLPEDGGVTRGLLRLRAAIELKNQDYQDESEDPEGEESSMARDPENSDWRAHTTSYGANGWASVDVSRRHSYSAFAAAAVVVLLSALIFGALATRLHSSAVATGSPTPAATPTLTPAETVPLQTVPALPGDVSVVSISMVSASDGWAVARTPNDDAQLLHYAGGRWTPSGDTYVGVSLMDISMDAPDDGWAVGVGANQVTGVVLHYSGGRWSRVQTPSIEFGASRVWAFSPSQVLVLAFLPKDKTGLAAYSGFGESALLRYENGTWTETLSPDGISDMTVLAGGDIWAACLDGHILHFQAGRWTTYSIAGQAPGQEGQPLAISMLSESDGWVAGFTNSVPQGMFLAHFDGRTWTRVPGPAASGPTFINTVALVSPSEGWAGGDLDSSEMVLLHDVDGRWQSVPAPYSGSIGRIVMVSATEGWATVEGGAASGLLHYQNGLWTPYDGGG